MNPIQAVKKTLSEMKPILEKHPDNANLKKWCRRFKNALDSTKKKGYSAEFEAFWTVYPRTTGTSKTGAYGNWCKEVADAGVDTDVVIAAAKAYARDMKGTEPSKVCHPSTWLSPTERRWESYDGVQEKIDRSKMCYLCFGKPDHFDGHKPVCSTCKPKAVAPRFDAKAYMKQNGRQASAGNVSSGLRPKDMDAELKRQIAALKADQVDKLVEIGFLDAPDGTSSIDIQSPSSTLAPVTPEETPERRGPLTTRGRGLVSRLPLKQRWARILALNKNV